MMTLLLVLGGVAIGLFIGLLWFMWAFKDFMG